MLYFLRKFHIALSLSWFAGFALLLVQCTPQEVAVTPDCSRLNLPFDVNAVQNIPEVAEHTLEMIRCSKNYYGFQDIHQMHDHFFGKDKFPRELHDRIKAELDTYHSLGFAPYMDKLRDDGKISTELRTTLGTLESDINRLTQVEQPDINGFKGFYTDKLNQIQQSNLCQSEKDMMSMTVQALQGATQFFFKHNKEGVTSRDCDKGEFWLKAGCFLFTVATLLVIYIVLIALFALLFQALGPATVIVEGAAVGTAGEIAVASVFEFFLVVLTANYWYNLCCEWDGEIDCSPPMGMYATSTGCNKYDFIIYGSGAYGSTTWGPNTNALPVASITTTPVLHEVSGVNLSVPSTITANTLCINNKGINTLPISQTITFSSQAVGALPPLEWGNPILPQHPVKEVNYDLTINTGLLPAHTYTYGWYATQTSGFAITPVSPPSQWKIRFRAEATGIQTIRFTVTNICTGETKSLVRDFYL